MPGHLECGTGLLGPEMLVSMAMVRFLTFGDPAVSQNLTSGDVIDLRFCLNIDWLCHLI